jgi:hypothetical protein
MSGIGTGMSPDGGFNGQPTDQTNRRRYDEAVEAAFEESPTDDMHEAGYDEFSIYNSIIRRVLVPHLSRCVSDLDFAKVVRAFARQPYDYVEEYSIDELAAAFVIKLTEMHLGTIDSLHNTLIQRFTAIWRIVANPEFLIALSEDDDRIPDERIAGARFDSEDRAEHDTTVHSIIRYYGHTSLNYRGCIKSLLRQTSGRREQLKEEHRRILDRIAMNRASWGEDNPRSTNTIITQPTPEPQRQINYWELLHDSGRGFVGIRLNGNNLLTDRFNISTEPGSVTRLDLSVLILPGRDILGITDNSAPPHRYPSTRLSVGDNITVTARDATPSQVTTLADLRPEPSPPAEPEPAPTINRRSLNLGL